MMQSFSALLLCNDQDARRQAERVLDEYNFTVSHASTCPDASELIRRNKFDLAIYDDDIPGAIDLAGLEAHNSAPRVVFVLLQTLKGNFILGKRIHLLLPKPINASLFVNSLKAAYQSILKEKRAAFRYTVDINAISTTLIQETGKRTLNGVRILNLSQSGLCLSAREMLPQGAMVKVEFRIPDSGNLIQSIGTVMWAHESGKAGVKFMALLSSHRNALCTWLDSLLPWDLELRPKTASRASLDSEAVQ